MRPSLALAAHSLRRLRGVLLAVAVVLGAFEFLMTQFAGYMQRTQAFASLEALVPDFVRTLAGQGMLSFMSFGGIVSLGYFHPVVLATLIGIAIAIGSEPAAEAETRFADLILARPISRRVVISRSIVVMLFATAMILAAMAASTAAGVACCTPADADRPSASLIGSLAVSLGSIVLCWGGVALAVAAAARRRATATAVVAVLAVVAFLLDYLGRVWTPAAAASRLSPFHYFEPMLLVSGVPLDWRNVAALIAVAVTGAAAAYVAYARRDL